MYRNISSNKNQKLCSIIWLIIFLFLFLHSNGLGRVLKYVYSLSVWNNCLIWPSVLINLPIENVILFTLQTAPLYVFLQIFLFSISPQHLTNLIHNIENVKRMTTILHLIRDMKKVGLTLCDAMRSAAMWILPHLRPGSPKFVKCKYFSTLWKVWQDCFSCFLFVFLFWGVWVRLDFILSIEQRVT